MPVARRRLASVVLLFVGFVTLQRLYATPQETAGERIDRDQFLALPSPQSAISFSPVRATAIPNIVITPDGPTSHFQPGLASSVAFKVKNTGNQTGTFSLVPSCTGAAVGSTCVVFPTQISLAQGDSINAGVAFTAGTSGSIGKIVLTGTLTSMPTVKDSGWYNLKVFVPPTVTPDGAQKTRSPSTAAADTFVVKNNATQSRTHNLTSQCSGAGIATSCTLSQSSVTLGGGAQTNVWISYTTGSPATNGRVVLKAVRADSNVLVDTGSVNFANTGTAPPIATPDNGNVQYLDAGAGSSVAFTIRNIALTSQTYALTSACSGLAVASACTLSATQITIEQGRTAQVRASFTSGSHSTTGQVKLIATVQGTSVKDSAWYAVSTGSFGVQTTPNGQTITRNQYDVAVDTFTVLNSGTLPDTYTLTASCTGGGFFAGTCTAQPTQIELAPGATGKAVVHYAVSTFNTYNTVQLTAQSTRDATVSDPGSYLFYAGWMGGGPQPVPYVRPKGKTKTFPPATLVNDTLVLRNLGPNGGTFYLTWSCTGTALAQCPFTPNQVTLFGGDSAVFAQQLFSGADGATGTLKLVATVGTGFGTSKDSATTTHLVSSGTPVTSVRIVPSEMSRSGMTAGTWSTVNFVVKNTSTGSLPSDINVSVYCNALFAGSVQGFCPVQLIQGLAPGASVNVPVNFTTGFPNEGGLIRAYAYHVATPSARDSASFLFTTSAVTATAYPSVTPDWYIVVGVPAPASNSATFDIRNTSETTAETYKLYAACYGPAIDPQTCTVSPSVVTLQDLETQKATVTYTATGAGKGEVHLTAVANTNSHIAETGSFFISTTTNPARVAVIPDTASKLNLAPNATHLVGFSVTNVGGSPGIFVMSAVCSGNGVIASTCAPRVSAIGNVAPGGSFQDTVLFIAGNAGWPGTVRLIAQIEGIASSADTGTYNITTAATGSATIAVTPKNQNASNLPASSVRTLNFTATNPGALPATFYFTAVCSGAGVVAGSCVPSSASPGVIHNLTPGNPQPVPVSFQTAATGSGKVTLTGRLAGNPAVFDTGFYNVTIALPGTPAVDVLPNAGTAPNLTPNAANTVKFTVQNIGTAPGSFDITVGCSGSGIIPNTCSASPVIIQNLAAGAIDTVAVGFTTGNPSTIGSVTLTARLTTNPSVTDNGTISTTTSSATIPGSLVVSLADVNPGTTIARDQCLTIALGDNAASECSDLRIVHALPTTRTLGTPRTPTLLYSSAHARPQIRVAANVTLEAGFTAPDSVLGHLRLGSTIKSTGRWLGTALNTTRARRLVIGFKADSLADTTGVYNYTLRLIAHRGASRDTTDTPWRVALVNRSRSPFGAGWWLSGLEQVVKTVASGDSLLWVGGDGSTRLYTRVGASTVFATRLIDGVDTLKAAGAQHVRYLPGGLRVRFDAGGNHIGTINRRGDSTGFSYQTVLGKPALQQISLPPNGSQRLYTFVFNAASGVLDSVRASASPQPRGVKVMPGVSRQIASIRDYDLKNVSFLYQAPTSHIIARRTTKRGFSRFFKYDSAYKMTGDSLFMSAPNSPIATNITPAESRGVSTPSGALQQPPDTIDVFTLIDGPRVAPVFDTTRYWINRFGAPTRIRNAFGDSTLIQRTDTLFPGLVTRVRHINGGIIDAWYSARGNADSTTDRRISCVGMKCATTRIKWDNKWDSPIVFTQPEGDSVRMFYDTANGNLLWKQDGRGDTTRVTFDYVTSGRARNQLRMITYPRDDSNHVAREHFLHDSLGNVIRAITPLGYRTDHRSDSLGRIVATYRDIDSQTAPDAMRQLDSTVFDAMDRDSIKITYAPRTGTDTLVRLTNIRDNDGLITRAERFVAPNLTNLTLPLVTQWSYDEAGRVVTETAPDGFADTSRFDQAGNSLSVTTRRKHLISFVHDALNRMTQRVSRSVSIPRFTEQGFTFPLYPLTGPMVLPGDSSIFAYDNMGNNTSATNYAAQISRSFDPANRLTSETQRISTYDTTHGLRWDKHVYQLAWTYDLNSRRKTFTRPAGDIVQYTYQPQLGALETITDRDSLFTYKYDLPGHLVQKLGPQGSIERFHYDPEGRLQWRWQTGPLFTGPYGNNTIHADTFTYDGRGKRQHIISQSEFVDYTYDGLGHIATVKPTQRSSIGNLRTEIFSYDALGNVKFRRGDYAFLPGTTDSTAMRYYPTTGRPWASNHAVLTLTDSTVYDSAGNAIKLYNEREFALPGVTGGVATSIARSYYGSNDKLLAFDRRAKQVQILAGQKAPDTWLDTFEEYRYDAFGRRVLRRARRDLCEAFCFSAIERFIWDGDDLVQEIRYRGANSVPSDTLEVDLGFVFDTVANPQCPPGQGACFDTLYSPQYGTVTYGYDGVIDRPIVLYRKYYGINKTSYENSTIYPQYNHRGDASGSTNTAPAAVDQQVNWPALDIRVYGFIATGAAPRTWFGTVIQQGQEATGLQFKRNRYYNPERGAFTQEDPIGLMGGLNLYGFADADPINLSDPLGLQGCEKAPASECRSFSGAEARAVFMQLFRWAPAIERTLSVAGGLAMAAAAPAAIGVAAEAAAGAGVVALGVTRPVVGRTLLPVVVTAIPKLQALAERFGASASQLANRVLTQGTRLVDNLEGNVGNINVILRRPDGASGFIRVTLDPTQSRIISAGLMRADQISHGLQTGRFTVP